MSLTGLVFSKSLGQEVFHSSNPVYAETVAANPNFTEAIALQFFIDKNYNMTVEGVIELKNASGKDISLNNYNMDLPYFTLKETKIGTISPNAFLVDMFSERNSILFAFKSQYTKPVVIGNNGKITFTFSAKVERPYNDIGGIRTLSFPFTLSGQSRSVSITVHLDATNQVLSAPKSPTSLTSKNIYSLSEESGKSFIFKISDLPISFTLSGNTDIPYPLYVPASCTSIQPVSCAGCDKISWYPESGASLAIKKAEMASIATTFTKDINASCKPIKATYMTGFIIIPEKSLLLPASWKIEDDGTVKDYYTDGYPYPYAESKGLFTIPIAPCTSDPECKKALQKLKTYSTSLKNDVNLPAQERIIIPEFEDLTVSNFYQNKTHQIKISNNSQKFLLLKNPQLSPTSDYSLLEQTNIILPPQGEFVYSVRTHTPVQTSNQQTELTFSIDGKLSYTITIKPVIVTLLSLIEILGYIFSVSLSLALISSLSIILYNKYARK